MQDSVERMNSLNSPAWHKTALIMSKPDPGKFSPVYGSEQSWENYQNRVNRVLF
jgi:hypothetical protein